MNIIIVLAAILFGIFIIEMDKNGIKPNMNDDSSVKVVEHRGADSFSLFGSDDSNDRVKIINFDIYKLKGKSLNSIKRRSFREGLKSSLNGTNKYKISYNPNIKLIASIKEDISRLKKRNYLKNGRDYYRVEKSVSLTVKFALFRDSKKTYYIDSITYRAKINAGSYSSYEDALYKIDKRLYYIAAQKLSNRILAKYNTIIKRVR